MNKNFLILVISFLCMLTSCEKNSFGVTSRDEPAANAALVKVAFLSATTVNIPVLVYLNGTRVSYSLVFNTPFPGGGLGTGGSNNSDYLVVTPGSTKVELNTPYPGTDIIASKFFETTQNFDAGKRQILFIADTATNTAAWNVNVDGNAADSGLTKVQFVNAIPNAASLDLYRGANAGNATLIIPDIKYKGASSYVDVAFGVGADSFFIRPAGALPTTTPVARTRIAMANQRLYTVYSRGYVGGTGTNRTPAISAIINQ